MADANACDQSAVIETKKTGISTLLEHNFNKFTNAYQVLPPAVLDTPKNCE